MITLKEAHTEAPPFVNFGLKNKLKLLTIHLRGLCSLPETKNKKET